MLSGRRLDLIDPSPLDIEIADIAHGLARVARWNGQTKGPEIFSVAQHSLLVEALFAAAERRLVRGARLAALLHDAPEYVIGDMISPFKAAIGGDYKLVEARLKRAIHIRFGLPRRTPGGSERRIKVADRASAYLEATALAGFAIAEARGCSAAELPIRRFRRLSRANAADRCRGAVPRPFRGTRRGGRRQRYKERAEGISFGCRAFTFVRSR